MVGSNSTRYHLLPDSRASMESNDDDENARLIDAAGDNTSPIRPNATSSKPKSITFHPTLLFRFLALIFTFISFMTFMFKRPGDGVAALVFLSFAMLRQVKIISGHYIGKFVEIRIEVTNATFKRTSFVKKVGNLRKGTMAILTDVAILLGLVPSITLGMLMTGCIEGAVLGYLAIIILLVSITDTGNPSTVTATLQKPAGAAWEVTRVGRAQAAGPEDADMARIFGKTAAQEAGETSPVPGPSVESIA